MESGPSVTIAKTVVPGFLLAEVISSSFAKVVISSILGTALLPVVSPVGFSASNLVKVSV